MVVMNEPMPRARKDGLKLQPVEDEIIVFDAKTDETHLLNKTAAHVWQKCDGTRTIAALAASVARATDTEPSEELVRYTLAQLQRKGLLMESVEIGAAATMTRRQFLGRFAMAAAAVPIIQTIKTTDPNQVAPSCGGFGSLCGPLLPRCCPPLVCGNLAPICGNPP